MKSFKSRIAVLAIIALAAIGFGGVATAQATPTCSVGLSAPVYSPGPNGNVLYSAQAYHCSSDVTKINWAGGNAGTRIEDFSEFPSPKTHYATYPLGVSQSDTMTCGGTGTCAFPYDYGLFTYAKTWYHWCWYVSATHNIRPVIGYQMYSSATQSWYPNGSFKWVYGPVNPFAC